MAKGADATNRAGGAQRRTCPFTTPAGPVAVEVADGAVVRVVLGAPAAARGPLPPPVGESGDLHPPAMRLAAVRGPLPPPVAALAAYLRGEAPALGPVAWRLEGGTRFQRAVWQKLAEIPAGATWGYRDLAAHLGRLGAARAVGQALSRNPLPVLLPCHRVVAADGLGGFSCGLAWKRYLLDLEGVVVG